MTIFELRQKRKKEKKDKAGEGSAGISSTHYHQKKQKTCLAMVMRRPLPVSLALALATATAATGVPAARGITPQRTRQTTPPPYHCPRTTSTTVVFIRLKSRPEPCPCAPTCRNISRPSGCCRGASCSLDFLILLFLILLLPFPSGKSGGARG